MKHKYLSLISFLLMLAGVQSARAQKMIVTKTNNQVIEFKVSEVQDVTFKKSEPVMMIITMKDNVVNWFEMSKVKNTAFEEAVHE